MIGARRNNQRAGSQNLVVGASGVAALGLLAMSISAMWYGFNTNPFLDWRPMAPGQGMSGAESRGIWLGSPAGVMPPIQVDGYDWRSGVPVQTTGVGTCWQSLIDFVQNSGCNTSLVPRYEGPGNNFFDDATCFGGAYTVGYTTASAPFARCLIQEMEGPMTAMLNAEQAAVNAQKAQEEQYIITKVIPAIALATGALACLILVAALLNWILPRRGSEEGRERDSLLPVADAREQRSATAITIGSVNIEYDPSGRDSMNGVD